MTKKDEHPCIDCINNGGGAYYKAIGHPIIVCSIDKHESINILGAEQGLNHLYKKCPLKEKEE